MLSLHSRSLAAKRPCCLKEAIMLPDWLPAVRAFSFLMLAGIATAVFDTELRNPCESPALPAGRIHVVVAGYEAKNCFTQYIWNLGLSNAHVFIYRRVAPERPLKHWRGPCGMTVHERLSLPNRGREASAFFDYVLEHYQNPPLAVVFLHGHGPWAYHTDCATIVGRVRLFYRGLVSPKSRAAEFSQHMVTLTRPPVQGDPLWMQDGAIEADGQGGLDARLLRSDKLSEEHAILAGCQAVFNQWSVNYTSAGFHSCCAMFVLPWERIRWYQEGFYRDAFNLFLEDQTSDYRGLACWEWLIYAWYQEPAQSASMTELYVEASQVAAGYDHATCSGADPVREC